MQPKNPRPDFIAVPWPMHLRLLRPEAVEFFRLERGHRWYGAALSPSGTILIRCLDCAVEHERPTTFPNGDAAKKSGLSTD